MRSPLHVLVLAPGERPVDTVERAIAHLGEEARIPHEIHVTATRERIGELQRHLLSNGAATARFAALCTSAGFARDEIVFNLRTLHAIDAQGPEDCSAGADLLLQLLRKLSSSDDASLTVIVAEDAGVAGYLLHACFEVAGRVSDRLLLDISGPAARRGRRGVKEAPECRHIEIPVLLWPVNEPVPRTYAEAVERRRVERRRVAAPDPLRLDCRRRIASVGETSLPLPAMQFFWLYYLASTPGERFPLAELTMRFGSGKRQPGQFVQKLSDGRARAFPADLQRAFAQLFPMASDKFDVMYQRSCGPHPGLPSTISKINAALRRVLGQGAGAYLIQGGRGAGGYRITLPPAAIQIAGAEVRKT